MILLSLALPIFVYAFNLPKLREVNHQVIVGMFIVGMGMYPFLIESGDRISHGNMGWGRQGATFILFIGAMAILIRNFRDKDFLKGKKLCAEPISSLPEYCSQHISYRHWRIST